MTTNQGSAAPVKPTAGEMPSPLRMLIIAGVALILICGGVLLMDSRNSPTAVLVEAPSELPVIAPVPDFSLTERSGEIVSRKDLLGTVWVADFIFTRCAGPCPKISAKFRAMHRDFADRGGVKFVSICLDPKNDTPRALGDYAKRFGADTDRWWFLTGENEKDVHELVGKGFLQSVVPAAGDQPLMHSTYVLVIDAKGQIRSAHDGLLTSTRDRVMADIETLLTETRG